MVGENFKIYMSNRTNIKTYLTMDSYNENYLLAHDKDLWHLLVHSMPAFLQFVYNLCTITSAIEALISLATSRCIYSSYRS